MQCTSAAYAIMQCLSVRLSFTFVHCFEMAKDTVIENANKKP